MQRSPPGITIHRDAATPRENAGARWELSVRIQTNNKRGFSRETGKDCNTRTSGLLAAILNGESSTESRGRRRCEGGVYEGKKRSDGLRAALSPGTVLIVAESMENRNHDIPTDKSLHARFPFVLSSPRCLSADPIGDRVPCDAKSAYRHTGDTDRVHHLIQHLTNTRAIENF